MTNHHLTSVQGGTASEDNLELTFMTKICGGGSCPTVYRTSRNTYVVQGYTVKADSAGVDLPAGEQLVEIPIELLEAAARIEA